MKSNNSATKFIKATKIGLIGPVALAVFGLGYLILEIIFK